MYRTYTGLGTYDPVDQIGKQETLTQDLTKFLETIGADFDKDLLLNALPINQQQGEKKAVWTPELEALVCEAEQRTLLDYGYDAKGIMPGPDGEPAPRSSGDRIVISRTAWARNAKAQQPTLAKRVYQKVLPESTRRTLYRKRHGIGGRSC